MTALAQATVGGRRLTDDEVILNRDGVRNGGLPATPHAATGALLAFSVAAIDAIGEASRQPSTFLHGLARLDVHLKPESIERGTP